MNKIALIKKWAQKVYIYSLSEISKLWKVVQNLVGFRDKMEKIQLIHLYTGFAKWRWGVVPQENGKTGPNKPHHFFQNYFLKNLDFEFW
jgi:hypothetical protein